MTEWIQIRRGQKAHAVSFRRFDGIHWSSMCGFETSGGVIGGGDAKCKACLREISKKKKHE